MFEKLKAQLKEPIEKAYTRLGEMFFELEEENARLRKVLNDIANNVLDQHATTYCNFAKKALEELDK